MAYEAREAEIRDQLTREKVALAEALLDILDDTIIAIKENKTQKGILKWAI